MARKPTYEELEQRVKELEGEVVEHKEVHGALRKSEERFRTFLDNLGDVAYEADSNGIITYANKMSEKITGMSLENLVGKTFLPLFTEESKKVAVDVFKRTLKGENPEYELCFTNGRIGQFKNEPLRDEKQKVIGVFGIARDITERKQAEEALRESEQSLSMAQEVADIGSWDWNIEKDTLTWSDKTYRQFGLQPNKITPTYEAFETFVHPADLDLVNKRVKQALDGEKPYSVDFRVVSKDGRKWMMHAQGTVYRDEDGKAVRFIGTGQDITERKRLEEELKKHQDYLERLVEERTDELTRVNQELQLEIEERKQAQEALRESEERHRFILDNITLGVALIDSDHTIVTTNPAQCKMVNKSVNQVLGKKCFREWEKREAICPHCPGVQAMATGQPAEVETEGVRDDGSRISVKVRAFPAVGKDGSVTGFVEIVEDIAEKKKLRAELQHAQKLEAVGTLAGGIAHDFNNLLTGIQGNVSLMLLNIDSTHPHYERLKNIEKQVKSGARLTSHLLGYARKGKYEIKPIDLNQLVKETSETFGRTRKQVEIHRDLAGDLSAIEADPGQIEQVLMNLFVNAADAMPTGGNLLLKTMNITHQDMTGKLYKPKRGDYVMLTVTDSGTGMDKKTMERIFDPFFTTKEMGRGTGLGLASAYGIIKAHAGYIDVESKKGHGTTLSIYLPASEKEVQKVAKSDEEVIEGTGTALLVDDEEVILEVGQDLLEAMGYRVLLARGGKQAIEVYKRNQGEIDIVVLDMVMPHMAGGKAYDRIKEINPDIKVLLSSGFSIDGEATEILERGCDGFIQKPFNMKELSQAIRKVLGKQ